MTRRGRSKASFFQDGVLAVNKPTGPTSHDVVDRLRRRFRPVRLGHAGTLDPFASGVLVLAFNQATRLSELLGAGEKSYQARLELGRATDTGDPTGQTVAQEAVPEFDRARAQEVLDSMLGERLQSPPAYSAAKHQGKPLYAYAREGVTIIKPPKPIRVSKVELLDLGPGHLDFVMQCSRGTYLRVLGQEVAAALGTVGHLASLIRRASLPFTLEEALDWDRLADSSPQELEQSLLSPARAMAKCGLPSMSLDDDLVWQLRQGRILAGELLAGGRGPAGQAFSVLDRDQELVAVLRWLDSAQERPGREYETIRVFPERSSGGRHWEPSASAMGAE